MAKMIPATYNSSTTSYAENTMYRCLQNHLDEDWTVIHSLPWLDESRFHLKQGECDFLILHPKHGMLVVEVKSGTPHYDGKSQNWHYDDGSCITDPFDQARASSHLLNKHLHKHSPLWRSANMPFGFAVAFPDAHSVTGNLRPDMGMDVLILEPDMDQMQRTVINCLGRFFTAKIEPEPEVIDEALKILQPTFQLVPALRPAIDRARREFVRLTDEQTVVMQGLASNKRLIVRGGAGTGKTLLIAARARDLAAKGKRVLVLCYNQALGKSLRGQLSECEDQVLVSTFHDLCVRVVKEAGAKLPDISAKEYWNTLLPDTAINCLDNYTQRFDAILVDEAQDFQSDWWLLVEELLANSGDSFYYLFGDEKQDLFNRGTELPFESLEYVLQRNCRNTKPVAEYALKASGNKNDASLEGLPDGPAPIIQTVKNEQEEVDCVRRVLHELINEQGIDVADVVILGCHRLEKSSFAGVEKLGNFVLYDAEEAVSANSVRYSTVHKFKGLEADCVLLTGIDSPRGFYGAEHIARFRYVGGSRARVVLYVFEW